MVYLWIGLSTCALICVYTKQLPVEMYMCQPSKVIQKIKQVVIIPTLFGTGPHCRTCEAPQKTPLWPGLQSSWSLQAEVPYIIWDTPVGLQVSSYQITLLSSRAFLFFTSWVNMTSTRLKYFHHAGTVPHQTSPNLLYCNLDLLSTACIVVQGVQLHV